MCLKFVKSLFVILLILLSFSFVFGQTPRPPVTEDLPVGIKENLAKQRIKQNEKDFQELISRSEEVVKLSEELQKSYENNKQLSNDDSKKLEKLEKMMKKIRQDLGAAEDKESIKDDPVTLSHTLSSIKEKAENLVAELKKTGRFAISVGAVESSNIIFRLVKLLRVNKLRS